MSGIASSWPSCKPAFSCGHQTFSKLPNFYTRRIYGAVRCQARSESNEASIIQKLALPAATLLGAALLMAATPDDALAARSGGRVGGSSGFSSRPRSMPSAPRSSGPSVRNYNYYSAPPLVSPYGFGLPFFGGGVGIVAPLPMFGIGSIFNIILLMFVLNVVLSVVRNFTSGDKNRMDSDDEDERW